MKLSALDQLLTLSSERNDLQLQLASLHSGKVSVQIRAAESRLFGGCFTHETADMTLAVRPAVEAVLQARLDANAAALTSIGVEVE